MRQINCYIPIKLRITGRLSDTQLDQLSEDLMRALAARISFAGQVLAKLPGVVLAKGDSDVGVKIYPPKVTWSGDTLVDLPSAAKSRFESIFRIAIDRAVITADIYSIACAGEEAAPSLRGLIAEAIDKDRYIPSLDLYAIPSYDDVRKLVKVPVKGAPRKSAALTVEQKKVVRSSIDRLNQGDMPLFVELLIKARIDGSQAEGESLELRILSQFARKNPKKFYQLLLAEVAEVAEKVSKRLQRTENNIIIPADTQTLLDIVADIVRLAKRLSGVRRLLQEREAKMGGVQRLIGLVDALVEIRLKLQTYLKESKVQTDALILDNLTGFINSLPRVSATFVAFVGDKRAQNMVYDLQNDLVDNYRWIAAILEKLQDIDTTLSFYRLFYADAADGLEEVQVLKESRTLYLVHASQNFLPTTVVIATLLQQANSFYDDWRGKAGDRKIEKLRKAIAQFERDKPAFDDYYGGIDWHDSYNSKVTEMHKAITEIGSDLKNIEQKRRDATYLNDVIKIEQKIPLIAARITLLKFKAGVDLDPVYHHEIGSEQERSDWSQRLAQIWVEIKKQYTSPDYTILGNKLQEWQKKREVIIGEIRKAAKRDFWINLGITAVAFVATVGVGRLLGGTRLSLVTVTLAEAGTFTLVTTAGQSLIMGKKVDVGDIIGQFTENALLFGVFRGLNIGFVAGARALAPGQSLAQLGIIFGANAVVGTGVPLLISRLETGKWPEDMGAFILGSLMLNAVVALVTGPKLLETLRVQNRADILQKLQGLQAENVELSKELGARLAKGQITQEQFDSMQARGTRMYQDFEAVYKRMASNEFTDAQLAALNLTRPQVQNLAQMAAEYVAVIKSAVYKPLPSVRALPPPNDVAGLVVVSPGTFEYNPFLANQGPDTLIVLFKKAGYEVTDTGGGVLRLTGPQGAAPTLLLLPARASVAPPALSDIVGKPKSQTHKGLVLLQQQPDAAKLLVQITAVAEKASPDIAKKLLNAVGRFLGPQQTEELKGLSHFLEVGGKPEVLAKVLAPAETAEWRVGVHKTLLTMRNFNLEAAQGLEAFFTLRSNLSANSALRVFANFEPGQLVGIFETIQRLQSRSQGLGNLIPGLRGDNPQMYKGVIGVLTIANKELDLHPDATLIFEQPILSGTGKVIRITDIRVVRPGVSSSKRIEVKEIYKKSALAKNPRAAKVLTLCKSPCIPEFATPSQLARIERLLTDAEKRGLQIDKARVKEYFHRPTDHADLSQTIDDFEQAMRKAKPGGTASNGETIMDEAELLQQSGIRKSLEIRLAAREGIEFDVLEGQKYPHNQVPIRDKGGKVRRLDSYDPQKQEIISRKSLATNNGQIAFTSEFEMIDHFQEFALKYPNGAVIADTAAAQKLGLANQTLTGKYILEVPVQQWAIPERILNEARIRGITIRDIKGRVYN